MQNWLQNPSGKHGLSVGAGDRDRTDDIQLGKLDGCKDIQQLSCKTARFTLHSDQYVTAALQNRRVHCVLQCDDGRYRLGIHDIGPGFEWRALAVAMPSAATAETPQR